MAQPIEVEMPNYIIYRNPAPGQALGSTAPLAFLPPKDSDELFDILRAKYPFLKTHSDRVREAVIEYLLDENPAHANLVPQPSTSQIVVMANDTTSYCPATFPSTAAVDNSAWSSPDTLSIPTSSFGDSPRPLSRQFSVATTATAPNEPSPPGLEQMTGVFSLIDSNQPKQRVRRKMTEQEKVEYRKRRIVKACDKCQKRKRKCHHNQQDMESLAAKSQKVPKSTAASTSKKPPAPNLTIVEPIESVAPNQIGLTDPFVWESMQSFEDFSDLLEEPLPDLSLDNLFSVSQTQWPWADTPDFTLMDVSGDSFSSSPPNAPGYLFEESPTDTLLSNESDQIYDADMMQFIDANRQANSMIWEHLRTGQPSGITHRTQLAQGNATQDNHIPINNEIQQVRYEQHSLPNANAVYDLLRSTTEQQSEAVQTHVHGSNPGDARRTTHSPRWAALKDATTEAANARRLEASKDVDEQTSAYQNLHHEDHSSNVNASGQSLHNMHTHLDRAKRKTDGIDASPMRAATQQASQTLQECAILGQQQLSLGELGDTILANMSPGTEMLILRRRIPKALHSIVDRNNANITQDAVHSILPASQLATSAQSLGLEHADINASQIGVAARQQNSTASYNTGSADIAVPPVRSTTSQTLQIQQGLTLESDCTSCGDLLSHLKQAVTYPGRLSDHQCRRDHFGRHLDIGIQVMTTLAALGCLLMLLSMLPPHTANLSLLLLAMTSAVRGAKGTHLPRGHSYWSEMWGTYLPSMAKGNDWRSKIDRRISELLRAREDTSSSTWVKETGMFPRGSIGSSQRKGARCGRIVGLVC